jgi:hypothetical protein
MAGLVLRDFFSLAPSAGRKGGSSSDPEARNASISGKGLRVTLAASHAGMINGNKVMYSPGGMKNSSHTWVWPQRRPIQVHHDDHADPIGRTIGSSYLGYGDTGFSPEQRDSLNPFFNDSLTKDNVVETAKILEDTDLLSQKDWKGVGELVLEGFITDSEAIEKILDGRYQGVSVTQYPKEAFCSLCGKDWVSDGPCEHDRGEKDEETGREMYLVVGDTDYVEVSYVNNPADSHAMGISSELMNNSLKEDTDNSKKFEDSFDLTQCIQTTMHLRLVDSLDKETSMSTENRKQETPAEDQAKSTDPKQAQSDSESCEACTVKKTFLMKWLILLMMKSNQL